MSTSVINYAGINFTIDNLIDSGMKYQKKRLSDTSLEPQINVIRSFSEPEKPFQVVFINKKVIDSLPFEIYKRFNLDSNVQKFKKESFNRVLDENDLKFLRIKKPNELAVIIFPHIEGIMDGDIGDDYTSKIFTKEAENLLDSKVHFGLSSGGKKLRKSKNITTSKKSIKIKKLRRSKKNFIKKQLN